MRDSVRAWTPYSNIILFIFLFLRYFEIKTDGIVNDGSSIIIYFSSGCVCVRVLCTLNGLENEQSIHVVGTILIQTKIKSTHCFLCIWFFIEMPKKNTFDTVRQHVCNQIKTLEINSSVVHFVFERVTMLEEEIFIVYGVRFC